MTAYMETANVAHVMEYRRSNNTWHSKCWRRVTFSYTDWHDDLAARGLTWQDADPPLKHVRVSYLGVKDGPDGLPSRPWCVLCARDLADEAGPVLLADDRARVIVEAALCEALDFMAPHVGADRVRKCADAVLKGLMTWR